MSDHSKLAHKLASGVLSATPHRPSSKASRVYFCVLTALAPHLVCLWCKLHFMPVPLGSGGRELSPSMHESPMFSLLSWFQFMSRISESKLHTSSKRSSFFCFTATPPPKKTKKNLGGSNWIQSICHICWGLLGGIGESEGNLYVWKAGSKGCWARGTCYMVERDRLVQLVSEWIPHTITCLLLIT